MQHGYSSSSSSKPSPEEYLQLLAERNRLKKKLNEKTPEQQRIEEKERGFSTHFRGANKVSDGTDSSEVQASGGTPNFGRLAGAVVGKSPSATKLRNDKVRINRGTISPAAAAAPPPNNVNAAGGAGANNKPSGKKKSWSDNIPVAFPTGRVPGSADAGEGVVSAAPSQIFFGKQVPVQYTAATSAPLSKRKNTAESFSNSRQDSISEAQQPVVHRALDEQFAGQQGYEQSAPQEQEDDNDDWDGDYADDFEVYYDPDDAEVEAQSAAAAAPVDEAGNSDRELEEDDPDACSMVVASPLPPPKQPQQPPSAKKAPTNNLVEYYKERKRLQNEESSLLASRNEPKSPKRIGADAQHGTVSPSSATKSPKSVKSPGRKQKKDRSVEFYSSSGDSFTASAANEIAAFVREFNSNMPAQPAISATNPLPAPALVPVHIRVRIHSNWYMHNNGSSANSRAAAAMTVSLHKIELRHLNDNVNIDISQCKWKLFSGVLPVQAGTGGSSGASSAATAARTLHKLCKYEPTVPGSTPSLSLMPVPMNSLGSSWKCAMESGKSIEIVFSGEAVFPEGLTARRDDLGGALYDDLALYLWNSGDPNSASRDVEVSIRRVGASADQNVQVWRGELPNPKQQSSFAHTNQSEGPGGGNSDEEKFTRFNLIQVVPLAAGSGQADFSGSRTVDSKAATISRQLGNSIKQSLSGTIGDAAWNGDISHGAVETSSMMMTTDAASAGPMTPIREAASSAGTPKSGDSKDERVSPSVDPLSRSGELSSPSRKLNYKSAAGEAAAANDRPAWLGDMKSPNAPPAETETISRRDSAGDTPTRLVANPTGIDPGSPLPSSFEAFKASRPSLTLKKRERKPRKVTSDLDSVQEGPGSASLPGGGYTPTLQPKPSSDPSLEQQHLLSPHVEDQSPKKAAQTKNVLKRRTSITTIMETDSAEQSSREDAVLRESLQALQNSNQFLNLSRLSLASDIVRRKGSDIDFGGPIEDSSASIDLGTASALADGETSDAGTRIRRKQVARTIRVAAVAEPVVELATEAIVEAPGPENQFSSPAKLKPLVDVEPAADVSTQPTSKVPEEPDSGNDEVWMPTQPHEVVQQPLEPSAFEEEEMLPDSGPAARDASPLPVKSTPPPSRPARITLSKTKLSAVQDSVSALLSNLSSVEIVKKNRKVAIAKGSNSTPGLEPLLEQDIRETVKPGLLTIYVLSNWGDLNYVGINGLDLFDSSGRYIPVESASVASSPHNDGSMTVLGDEILSFEDIGGSDSGSPSKKGRRAEFISPVTIESVSSNPTDVNILASNATMAAVSSSISALPAKDPRVISNILDQHNYTTSDLHVWLAPIGFYDPSASLCEPPEEIRLDEGSPPLAVISVQLKLPELSSTGACPLSTIRIWNYNKSRTHSNRGVKDVLITLDDDVLYRGNIAKAPGLLSSSCLLGASTSKGRSTREVSSGQNEEYYYESISMGEPVAEVLHTISKYDVYMGYVTTTSASGAAAASVLNQLAMPLSRDKWKDSSVGSPSSGVSGSLDLGFERRPIVNDVSRPMTADSGDEHPPVGDAVTVQPKPTGFRLGADVKAEVTINPDQSLEPVQQMPNFAEATTSTPDILPADQATYSSGPKSVPQSSEVATREEVPVESAAVAASIPDAGEPVEHKKDDDMEDEDEQDEYEDLMDEIRQLEGDTNLGAGHMQPVVTVRGSDGPVTEAAEPEDAEVGASSLYGLNADEDLVFCQYVTLLLEDTWGDDEYIGLSGVEVLQGVWCLPVDMTDSPGLQRITAEPRDLSSVGLFDDPRVPENLLVSSNRQRTRLGKKACNYNSTLDKNMWLVPFTPPSAKTQSTSSSVSVHHITFNLGLVTGVAGIRVWNYNKAFEGITRGVKSAQIFTYIGTGKKEPVTPRYLGRVLLRPGPGCDGVRFEQLVLFRDVIADQSMTGSSSHSQLPGPSSSLTYVSPPIRQDYQVNFFGPAIASGPAPKKGHPNKGPAPVPEATGAPVSFTGCPTSGMMWKFTLLNNHGDEYYIGLDAIEFFDENGNLILFVEPESPGPSESPLRSRVYAVPHSVADVQSASLQETCDGDADADDDAGLGRDRRAPRGLFQYQSHLDAAPMPWGYNLPVPGQSAHHGHGWLSALSKSMTESERLVACKRVSTADSFDVNTSSSAAQQFNFYQNNTLFVLFDRPVTVSLIRLYNYSKTPARGVNEFSLEVDTRLIYLGGIPLFDPTLDNNIAGKRKPSQSVVFTSNNKLLLTEKANVHYCGSVEQDVVCINNRMVMSRSKSMYNSKGHNPMAEGVRIDISKRPATANRS